MGLLQIGGAAKQKCAGRVVGIDLGTTYSLAATVKDGMPVVLGDVLPSVVWFGEAGDVEVGYGAREKAGERTQRTIASAKRFMGRGHAESQHPEELSPYHFDAKSDGPVVYFELGAGRKVTPIEVSAEVLRVLRERSEEALGGELDGAVITVPAYFDDAQRQATRDAARLAGINVLRLLNEPTAAALAYGLDKKKQGKFAVFDMGGGTFDISILELRDGVFQVLSTGGDSRLGGDDFDRVVAEWGLREAGIDPKSIDQAGAARALASARSAKETLTSEKSTTLAIEGRELTLDRPGFDALIANVTDRTQRPIRRALKDADLKVDDLDGVLLVGGSTRVPAVRAFVAETFKTDPLGDIDPDKVVALGAAVQADLLGGSGPRGDILLLDVLPLSLGLETMGGVVEKLLHRNQTIPASASQEFTTYADNQTGMNFHVVQGEREVVADCRSLAQFKLSGLPPLSAGLARVRVSFNVDADGILHVSAQEGTTGVQASVEVKPSYGLDDETIERMILESIEHGAEDIEQRMLLDARVEAERLLHDLRGALEEDRQLLSASEIAELEAGMKGLEEAKSGTNHRLIRTRHEKLNELSVEFAARRMDRSIKGALAGRNISDVSA